MNRTAHRKDKMAEESKFMLAMLALFVAGAAGAAIMVFAFPV